MSGFNYREFTLISQSSVLLALKLNNDYLKIIDEDEEMEREQCMVLQSLITSSSTITERSVWKFPSSSDWWESVYPILSENMFISHFRLDRQTFDWVVNEVKSEMTTEDSRFRAAVTVERKVAVSLKCLATTCDMLTVASLFGIGRSSVHKYFLQFVNIVYKKLVPKLIRFPTIQQSRKNAEDFEKLWGFPMAVAAIDGTHIPFNPPTSLATDFHNYKGWSSIMALAMCDARGKAIWIKSGMPGRMSDSGAFKATVCYAKLESGELLPQETKQFGDTNIPYLILGDSGFAMERWLSKPFTHHNAISENQKIFNYRHSRARRSVENMFGRVKLRWRRLLRGLDVKYENAHKVISAAFALHNLCENYAIPIEPTANEISENLDFEHRYQQPLCTSQTESSSGLVIRNSLMDLFSNQSNPWTGE